MMLMGKKSALDSLNGQHSKLFWFVLEGGKEAKMFPLCLSVSYKYTYSTQKQGGFFFYEFLISLS